MAALMTLLLQCSERWRQALMMHLRSRALEEQGFINVGDVEWWVSSLGVRTAGL